MEKGREFMNDIKNDAEVGNDNATACSGGDLSRDEGIDLNASADNSAGAEESFSKRGMTRGVAGAMAVVEGINGFGGSRQMETFQPPPLENYHIETQAPSDVTDRIKQFEQLTRQFGAGDYTVDPKNLNAEYDDGKFDPNRQREIDELASAERESLYGDHIDPPETTDVEQIGEDLNVSSENELEE